ARVAAIRIWIALVVEVVQQSADSPQLFIAPRSRACARIAASTARQWRRSDCEETHDSNVESASSRESWSGVGPAVIAVRNDSRVAKLVVRERPAAGEPAGLLILHHGRGADELDLLGLADALD